MNKLTQDQMQAVTEMKRRIKQNIWDNWNGYEGTRKVEDFGTDEWAARTWLAGKARLDQAMEGK